MSDDSAGVRFPPPFAYVAGLGAAWLLGRLVPLPGFRDAWADPLALIFGAAGLLLVAAALGLFWRAGTDPLPMKPTSKLVFAGPYRFTRNPMYVAMALIYVGVTLLFDLTWALVLLPLVLLVIRTRVIALEERYLEAKFGDEYRAYKGRVRRWL